MEDLQGQLDTLATELKQVEDEMAEQDMDPLASGDSVVRSFGGDAYTLFSFCFVYCFLFLFVLVEWRRGALDFVAVGI